MMEKVHMQPFQYRVILVDDNRPIRDEVRKLLTLHNDIQIVGEARDGKQALELVAAHRPDVVVLDIKMPNMNGIEAASLIKKFWVGTIIIGLCVIQDAYVTAAFLRAGAVAVLSKDSLDILHSTIQRACRNKWAA